MRIPELQPLIEKAALLRDDRKVRDIYEFIWAEVQNAQIPSMAQSACEKIILMTHPKAWGDRDADFGASYLDWFRYLDELKSVANDCGQAIFEKYQHA
jgi:predicted ATP-dependent protease